MLKVSIVLPFYNAEKYLSRCIDSIMRQTYSNYELLLINDGSRDKSLAIAYNYKQKDSRIHVIDKKNTGVSDTRNYGIKLATGEYLFFVDADDWIEPNALEILVENLETTRGDWSTSAIWMEYSNQSIISAGHSSGIIGRDEALIALYNDSYIRPVVWGKLYRLEWIRRNAIYFNPNIFYSEDVLFMTKILLLTNDVTYLEIPLYHYYVDNEESALHKWNNDFCNPKLLSKWNAYEEMEILLKKSYSKDSRVWCEFIGLMIEVAREMLHLCIKDNIYNQEYYKDKYMFIRKNLNIYWKIRKKSLRKIAILLAAYFPKLEFKLINLMQ